VRLLHYFSEGIKTEKVICAIDGGFLTKTIEKYAQAQALLQAKKLDYSALVHKMAGNISLLRSYYYTAPPFVSPNPTPTQKTLQSNFETLKNMLLKIPQMEIRLGRIKRSFDSSGNPKFSQKGVDTLMAIDLVTFSTKKLISHAVLLTGDSDLIPAIQVVKNEGVIVKVITFKEHPLSTADQIRQCADIVEEWDEKAVSRCFN